MYEAMMKELTGINSKLAAISEAPPPRRIEQRDPFTTPTAPIPNDAPPAIKAIHRASKKDIKGKGRTLSESSDTLTKKTGKLLRLVTATTSARRSSIATGGVKVEESRARSAGSARLASGRKGKPVPTKLEESRVTRVPSILKSKARSTSATTTITKSSVSTSGVKPPPLSSISKTRPARPAPTSTTALVGSTATGEPNITKPAASISPRKTLLEPSARGTSPEALSVEISAKIPLPVAPPVYVGRIYSMRCVPVDLVPLSLMRRISAFCSGDVPWWALSAGENSRGTKICAYSQFLTRRPTQWVHGTDYACRACTFANRVCFHAVYLEEEMKLVVKDFYSLRPARG
ncbi:Protein of unknown function [Pyronema omphalodes CBS 100304]|uniref:Uncharacterized protein n=1 Tax=Pyronema omphalodes (strain CBS 100304) TaxID=1076935 RepID=U4L2U6_PYROM|nr:Protein of unknown function [Pyronema omphalodes CBS 100304]